MDTPQRESGFSPACCCAAGFGCYVLHVAACFTCMFSTRHDSTHSTQLTAPCHARHATHAVLYHGSRSTCTYGVGLHALVLLVPLYVATLHALVQHMLAMYVG